MSEESYLAALCRAAPYHLVDRILSTPDESALLPDRCDGTVLYADVVGFTSLCEELARASSQALSVVSDLLDRLITSMQFEAFFPMDGYVVEFGGDALTVVFRGPAHAHRAAAAALRVQQVVARTSPALAPHTRRTLEVRIGLATGSVHLLVLGDLARRVSVCGGKAVHRAIALQMQAAPGQCLADESCRAALGALAQATVEGNSAFGVEALLDVPPPKAREHLDARLKEHVGDKIRMLEPFVAAPLARRLRTTPLGWKIESETRRVAIVFMDIGGFGADPQTDLSVASVLGRSLTRAFHKYEGLLLKCIATDVGHRAMLLFGVHRPAANDVEKAVLASLEALSRIRGLLGASPVPLTARVGIHTGQVFFGAVGSSAKHDLTAIGDEVNLAARVVAAAAPFEVLVTDAALERAPGAFVTKAHEPLRAKGKSEPVAVHSVTGIEGGRAHHAQRRGKQRVLFGDPLPQQQMARVVESALEGRGSLVGLCGAAGTGKSALLANAVDQWLAGGGLCVVSRCRFSTSSLPFAPARQFFEAFAETTDEDSESIRASKLRARFADMGIGAESTELWTLLQPVHRPDGQQEELMEFSDPRVRGNLMETILRFIERRASEAKVFYVLEDVHHSDSATLELVRRLAPLSHNRRALFVATYRDTERLGELRRALDHEIFLGNLDQRATGELVLHELRASSIADPLVEFFFRRTQGNPEHLLETVRFLSDRSLLREVDGAVSTGSLPVEALEDLVPPDWAHVALARLDGLSELERRVLRTASAIGLTFSARLLEAADQELPKDIIDSAMRNLERQQVIEPETSPKVHYRFRDETTRSMAYAIIPESERRALHRRIAEGLEAMAWPESELAAVIAHHRERAGQIEAAMHWLSVALEQARRAGLARLEAHHAHRLQELASRPKEQT